MASFVGVVTLALACLVQHAAAYYVPGTYPQEFKEHAVLQAQVSSLTSPERELPYEYYTMPFCKPIEGVHRTANSANLGTILQGLRIENSPYNFSMKMAEKGKLVCKPSEVYPSGAYKPLAKREASTLRKRIKDGYRVNMVLDNLPVLDNKAYDLQKDGERYVRPGYDIGYVDSGKVYIYNHLIFTILVHASHGEYQAAAEARMKDQLAESIEARKLLGATARRLAGSEDEDDLQEDENTLPATPTVEVKNFWMVVGFQVMPCSVFRKPGDPIADVDAKMCTSSDIKHQEVVEGAPIVYTYDVFFKESPHKWASRWDAYLAMPGGKVHWLSILNSILVVLVMASIVAMILIRTVRRDLAQYEQLMVDSNSMDLKEEAGWKLVASDVFRAPADSKALAVRVGSGMQIICTTVVTIFLAMLGFCSPASRGALLTTLMFMYVLLALVGGFAGVIVWGLMERSYAGWMSVAMQVSLFYPGITMLIFTLLNMVIKHTGSTGAVPVGIYFTLLFVWFLVSVPLTFIGGTMATKMPIMDWPVKTNQIPRHIPPPPTAAHPWLLFFAAGILPFGTLFIELYFTMTSIWLGFFYYLFGFVFIIGVLTTIINAEISLLCTYVQLCAEDYTWWWGSFHRGGSVTFYIMLFAIYFLTTTLHVFVGFLPVFIYFCYMTIVLLGAYLAMGTIGFAASMWFVVMIFKAVKAD